VAVPILESRTAWYCPNCPAKDFTTEAQPHTRYHACPGLRGISSPMVRVGVRAKVEAVVREDYVIKDSVTTDDSGRPIMAVVTTRDDGTDCAVFAPTALATSR
jgi:hypothetical protein